MSSPAAVRLRGVVKRFGEITAVDGLDLDVPQGICLGLLGPNGAGKSTTMRMLTGQVIANEGEIRVLGYELPGESKAARAQMGVVPQLDNLDVDVTVEDNLAVYARLYRVKDVRGAVERCLELARLQDRRRDEVDKLSGGMRRRLLLARGLVHEPPLLLLDEPTVGLDPQIRTELWSLIDGLRTARQDDPDVDPLHRGGRAPRRRGRGDGQRQDHRPRQAGRADRRARRARDRRGLRAARPARRGPRRGRGRGAGGAARPARRSRSSAPSGADGVVPDDAVRRAATLEDVFVLLTGEEAE